MDRLWAAESAGGGGGGDGYWRLALMLAAIVILGLFARWRKIRQPPVVKAKELRERDREPNRYRDAADRALVELVEAGRDISAQVDAKVRFLNRLVKDADDRIARLEKLLSVAEAASPSGAGEGRAVSDAPLDGGGSESRPVSASRRFRSDLQARVVALSEEGGSIADIAKATGLSTLEIQLALKHTGDGSSPSGDGQ